MSAATNNILSYAGWYFLPNLATTYLQYFLYNLLVRAGNPKPTPGTPRHTRDRHRIHTAVILAYLAYTVYEADYQLRRNHDFYTLLSLPHSSSDKDITSRFRRLTVQFHPDKVGDRAGAQELYMQMQLAKDTLLNPVKRFAYERFGPEALRWQSCQTVGDFVVMGLKHTSGYYVGSGALLVILGLFGYLKSAMFWRYLVMATLFVVELQLVTRPQFPAFLGGLINPFLVAMGIRQPYLPWQMIVLLRKLSVTLFIALAQLGPILQQGVGNAAAAAIASGDGVVSAQQLELVDAITKATDAEATRLMGLELLPFAAGGPRNEGAVQQLRGTLKEWLVQNTIRNDIEVRGAVSSVLQARRQREIDDGERRLPVPPHVS